MVSFETFPKEWGIMLYPEKTSRVLDSDIEFLESLRDHFKERQGEILSWKFDLAPEFLGCQTKLARLWENGFIVKFAGQFHTVHGNPEYIKWYIWGENDVGLQKSAYDGDLARTTPHFVQR